MTPFNKPRFWVFHSSYWIIAGMALFLYGLRYGHWEIALIRNFYSPLIGFVVSFLMSIPYAQILPQGTVPRLLFISGSSIAGAIISSVIVNPITYGLLGQNLSTLPASEYFTDGLYFVLFYLVWSLLYLQFSNLPLFQSPASSRDQAARPAVRQPRVETINVEKSGAKMKLFVNDITHIVANGDYVHLFTSAERYLKLGTISSFEAELGAEKFKRIHRSVLVNVNKIRSISGPSKGQYRIKLEGDHEVRSSRNAQSLVATLLPKAE